MNKGHVLLHRALLDSQIFASQIGLKIWIWLLFKAAYNKRHVPVKIGKGETTVTLEVGELLFGRFKAEEALNIDGSTIYKWLNKMEEMEMIKVKSNTHYSIVTIENYATYQMLENKEVAAIQQPSDSHSSTIQQPSDSQVTHISPLIIDKPIKPLKQKELPPLPAESELERIFYEELHKKCKALDLEFISFIDPLKAREKYLIYVQYCKDYYGTKKQYKDYNAAARTFQSKIKEFENFKKPEEVKREPRKFSNFNEVFSALYQEFNGKANVYECELFLRNEDQNGRCDYPLDQVFAWGCKLCSGKYRINEQPKRKPEMNFKKGAEDIGSIMANIKIGND